MQNIKDLEKINNQFDFIRISYKTGSRQLEPSSGNILVNNGLMYYFEFVYDYIDGNVYIVKDINNKPIYYFTLSYPYVNPDNGKPVHDTDEFFEDDRDFESSQLKKMAFILKKDNI